MLGGKDERKNNKLSHLVGLEHSTSRLVGRRSNHCAAVSFHLPPLSDRGAREAVRPLEGQAGHLLVDDGCQQNPETSIVKEAILINMRTSAAITKCSDVNS